MKKWIVSPQTCFYDVADHFKKTECKRLGLPTGFEALGITEWPSQSKTIAIIPLDDSTRENAMLVSAAPEMYDVLKRFQNNPKVVNNLSLDDLNSFTYAIAKAEGRAR